MNRLDYYIVTSICIYCLQLSYSLAHSRIQIQQFSSINLEFVLPAAIFVALFHALIYLYNKFGYKIIHSDEYLGGNWIYRLRNDGMMCKLYGIFTIKHDIFGIKITNGKVWNNEQHDQHDKLRGVWTGETVRYSSNRLEFLFSHNTLHKLPEKPGTISKDQSYISGISILDLCKSIDKSELNGIYYDINDMSPSQGVWESKRVTACSANELKTEAFNFRYPDESTATCIHKYIKYIQPFHTRSSPARRAISSSRAPLRARRSAQSQ